MAICDTRCVTASSFFVTARLSRVTKRKEPVVKDGLGEGLALQAEG